MAFMNMCSSSITPTTDDELHAYLKESTIETNFDPLEFWKLNSIRFPVLSKLARIYLAVPSSSGEVERLFSIAGNIKRIRRNRLSNEKVEHILLWREYRTPRLQRIYETNKRKRTH